MFQILALNEFKETIVNFRFHMSVNRSINSSFRKKYQINKYESINHREISYQDHIKLGIENPPCICNRTQ